MDYRLLGPLDVRAGDRAVALGGPKQRGVLAVLLLRAGQTVSVDTLIDEVWGERPPATVNANLHNCVSRLRKGLGAETIERRAPGYVLHARDDEIDARRFERALAASRTLEPAERAAALREALSMWRGAALADLAFEPFAEAEAARLEELRLVGLEERIDAELELGRHEQLVAELDALVARHPLRERLRRAQLLALYRAHRKPEALQAFQDARLALIDELGLEPSDELRELERMIHRDDPALEPSVPSRVETAPRELRRPAVVLCIEPEAGDETDPETAEHELSSALEAVRAAIERHGGSVQQLAGDEALAFFGIPSAHEDDALRALRAAVELREELAALDVPARVGLAAGDVVAAGDAPPQAGPAVRRSRRLKELAAPGAIVVGDAVLALVGSAVDMVPVDATGSAFRLLRLDPDAPAVARRLDAPLVGRERELELLDAALDRAVEQRCPVRVVLSGDPGIGKTRLAREFVTRHTDASVLSGRCVAYGQAARVLALAQLVGGASDVVGRERVPDELVPLLAAQLPTAPNPDVFRATRLLLESVADRAPVVAVLEDLHWGAPGLLDLVEYLTAWSGDLPLLLLCVARPELLETRAGWRPDEFALEPLGPVEARALVREREPGLSTERADAVIRAGEGNPLFLEQLLAYEGDELPPSLEMLLASRLDRLEPEQRTLIGHAAVAGREFWRGAVEQLADGDRVSVASSLSALVRRRFVEPTTSSLIGEEAFVFHHALIRDAAYASVPKVARAELHERVARWIEPHAAAGDEVVGFHLEQAFRYGKELGRGDELLAREAATRLGTAGLATLKRMAVPATVELLPRAMSLLPLDDPERLELGCELGTALKATGNYRRVEQVLDEVADTAARTGARRAELRARIELVWPRVLRSADSVGDALVFVERVLEELAAGGDDRSLERAWFCLAALRGRIQFWHAGSEEAARRALDHALAGGFSPAGCLALLANDFCDGPLPATQAIERCGQLLEDADPVSEAGIRLSLGHLRAMRGDFRGAASELDAAVALNAEFGQSGAKHRDEALARAEVEWLSGNSSLAETTIRDASAFLEGADDAWLATLTARRAELYAELGSTEEAITLARRAAELVVPGDLRTEAAWRRAHAIAGGSDGEARAREAIAILEATDEVNEQAKAHLAYAHVLDAAGRTHESNAARSRGAELLRLKENEALLARIS
ncbi:MAG TPA: BTAD domain-containing putative transcriptional regulator [Gaiellaceae bacterium]|nr:BTAD domain-containing putative transcriptional regulator [Gaiellaceae bacterium]